MPEFLFYPNVCTVFCVPFSINAAQVCTFSTGLGRISTKCLAEFRRITRISMRARLQCFKESWEIWCNIFKFCRKLLQNLVPHWFQKSGDRDRVARVGGLRRRVPGARRAPGSARAWTAGRAPSRPCRSHQKGPRPCLRKFCPRRPACSSQEHFFFVFVFFCIC